MNRAYSTLTLKRAAGDGREIIGIASTPRVDKAGDILEPLGAEFTLPMPLLWMHAADAPIGKVTHAKATASGIEFRAQIAKVDKPGKLKDRVDEAMDSIEADLVRGISVGFQPLEWKGLPSGGARFLRWSWHELSVVTLACNTDCSIQAIKAADDLALQQHRQPLRVVKLQRPVSAAVVAEMSRDVPPTKGLPDTDALFARTIGTLAKTADDCFEQIDERLTKLEQRERLFPTEAQLLAMPPDEFCSLVTERRRLGLGPL